MLRVEDCKSGVEIVCIDTLNIDSETPVLTKGGIYTIKRVGVGYHIGFMIVMDICLTLEEIAPIKCDTCGELHDWVYLRRQFKLRDIEKLNEIFGMKDNKLPVLEDA